MFIRENKVKPGNTYNVPVAIKLEKSDGFGKWSGGDVEK